MACSNDSFDWSAWMHTTSAGAHAIDSYRLVQLELARRLKCGPGEVGLTWRMNHYENLFDVSALPLTRDAQVSVDRHSSQSNRDMTRVMFEIVGHPSTEHLENLVTDDGRVIRTGMNVEFLIDSNMVDRLAVEPLTEPLQHALLSRRKEDAERLRFLEPHPIFKWRTRALDLRIEYLGLVGTVLRSENPDLVNLRFIGQTHFGSQNRMCFIEVYGCDEDTPRRRAIRAKAGGMLGRLGIVVEMEGRDVFDIQPKRPSSAHEALKMISKYRQLIGEM